MVPRTEEQYEEIRKEKKELIMDTALELFAEKGYLNCSISNIAIAAKISKGLMYNYFESKEELLTAVLNRGFDEMMKIFDPNKDGVLEPEEMEFFITEMFSMLKRERHLWKLYFQVTMQPSAFKLIEKRIEEMYTSLYGMIYSYFQNLGFENPQMEMLLFGCMIDGITMDYIMKPELVPIDDIRNELVNRYCKKQINK